MSLIRMVAAWIDTGQAGGWMKAKFGDADMLLRRMDPEGLEFAVTGRKGEPVVFGIRSEDLVPLGRYLLAVAADQGQNLNPNGFPGGLKRD